MWGMVLPQSAEPDPTMPMAQLIGAGSAVDLETIVPHVHGFPLQATENSC